MPLDMPYNTNLKVTTSKYYIPSGRCIQAINYSKKKGDGGGSLYGDRLPDSLTQVFHTRAGREVRDGGGIKPDVEVKADSLPNIAYYLSIGGLDSTEVMFDYVVDYVSRHPSIPSAETFALTDADYQEFRERVLKSGFKYDMLSRKRFDELVKTAKYEGYYDQAREAFDALESKLKHDVATDMDKHRETIMHLLETEIVSAYYYQAGALRAGLKHDGQLKEAMRLLRSQEEYAKLLRP
jgi:carboxyl-terminal processing protease